MSLTLAEVKLYTDSVVQSMESNAVKACYIDVKYFTLKLSQLQYNKNMKFSHKLNITLWIILRILCLDLCIPVCSSTTVLLLYVCVYI